MISIALTDILICAMIVLVIIFQETQNRRLVAIVERSEALTVRLKSAADSSHTYHRQIVGATAKTLDSLGRIEALLKTNGKPSP